MTPAQWFVAVVLAFIGICFGLAVLAAVVVKSIDWWEDRPVRAARRSARADAVVWPCGAPSGYHDDGDPMCCELEEGHDVGVDHWNPDCGSWRVGTFATDDVPP